MKYPSTRHPRPACPERHPSSGQIFGRNITTVARLTANSGQPISEKKDVRMDGKKYLKKFDLLSLSTSVVSFIVFNIIFWNVQSYHI